MQLLLDMGHVALRGACAALLLAAAVPVAHANWLSRIGREVGEAGTHGARLGAGALDRAAAYVKSLPPPAEGAALAAHATPEGHWKFANRDGEVFTAGTPAELQRAVPTLLPQAPRGSKLAIYLSEDTVFGDRALLDALPANAVLHVVARNDSYPLVRAGMGRGAALYAAVRPNLRVELIDRELLGEALAQLERPISRASIRTLALEPGGPSRLASVPRFDRRQRRRWSTRSTLPRSPGRCARCAARRCC